jgi:membrane protein YqaA with SNARE-associated domain
VQLRHASPWIRKSFHLALALGGLGIFAISFLDSTFLSFPFLTDVLVVEATIHKREWTPYYVLSATLGSLFGCLVLYYLARRGGEAFFKRRARRFGNRVHGWVRNHAFWSMAVPATLPPPFPFEVFTIAEGAFGAPLSKFIFGVLLGRGVRFGVEAALALEFGAKVNRFLYRHQMAFVVVFIALGAALGLAYWLHYRHKPERAG